MRLSGRARRLRGGYKWIFLVPTFLGKCASLQHRACVGAKLDCKAVIQRSGQERWLGLKVAVMQSTGRRRSSSWARQSAAESESGDASTSPAVLFELARCPSRLSGDGSLHWALRQNTGPSRRQLGRSRPRDSSDECTLTLGGGVGGPRRLPEMQGSVAKRRCQCCKSTTTGVKKVQGSPS